MIFKKLKPYRFTKKELYGFLSLAVPVVISSGTEAVMMFVDRLFLSNYSKDAGEAYLNASMIGAVTAFTLICFFILTAGFSNSLVAQYCGSGQKEKASDVAAQVFFFSLGSYPLILIFSLAIPYIFSFFDHSELQTELETLYAQIMLWGAFITVFRGGLSGFFTGIQQTKVVMLANLSGLLINIPLNYLLIYGAFGFPSFGIAGAAYATIIASSVSVLIMLLVYFSRKMRKEYKTGKLPVFNLGIMKKLLIYGSPSGFETLTGLGAFSFFLSAMNSYGEDVGAAVSIAINWDMMFFIPMIGAQIAATSMVGHHMGSGNVFEVKRTVFLCCFVMGTYALLIGGLMITFTSFFVQPFLPKMKNPDEVQAFAEIMVRLAAFYLFADVFHLAFASALKGAGDTKAVMFIFVSINIFFGILIYFSAYLRLLPALGSWFVFIAFVLALALGMYFRYKNGAWQKIRMISS